MTQESKSLTVERETTLILPGELVAKLVLEAVGAPLGARATTEGDYGGYEASVPAVRVRWSVEEPVDPRKLDDLAAEIAKAGAKP